MKNILIFSLLLVGCQDYTKPFSVAKAQTFCYEKGTKDSPIVIKLLKGKANVICMEEGSSFNPAATLIDGTLECNGIVKPYETCYSGSPSKIIRCSANFICRGLKK